MQQEYVVISLFPFDVITVPPSMLTESSIWKNCVRELSSSVLQVEFNLLNAALMNLEAEELSPGSPNAPIPWLYGCKFIWLENLLMLWFGDNFFRNSGLLF